jgi:hypothetical protein
MGHRRRKAISDSISQLTSHPRRDLNPCYRRERMAKNHSNKLQEHGCTGWRSRSSKKHFIVSPMYPRPFRDSGLPCPFRVSGPSSKGHPADKSKIFFAFRRQIQRALPDRSRQICGGFLHASDSKYGCITRATRQTFAALNSSSIVAFRRR